MYFVFGGELVASFWWRVFGGEFLVASCWWRGDLRWRDGW